MAGMANNTVSQVNGSQVTVTGKDVKDDRIYPETRWVGACIPPFLIAAFIILYIFPDNTKDLFAWTIAPRMTPMLMGAGYISGSYFFVRLVMGGKWHWFGAGLLPITAFTWFMGLATLLHWEKFNHTHISFYAWLILYVVTPFLVPFLWFRNRVADPGTLDPRDAVVPDSIRWAMGAVGVGLLAIAVFMFLFPSAAISIWPWKLTPLTARVIAGWFALPAVVGVVFAMERRWSAWRITLQSQIAGIALILLGVVRAWSDFDQNNPLTWVLVIGLFLLLSFLVAIHISMDARRHAITPAEAQ